MIFFRYDKSHSFIFFSGANLVVLSASGSPRKVFDFLAPKYNCCTKQKSGQPIAKRLHIDASKHSPQFLSNSKELQDVFCEKLGCELYHSQISRG